MGSKYEFTDEILDYDGHTLHRIRRLSDNKIGGWIEKEENLSQEGRCWVDNDAKVYENARVYGAVEVCDNALVFNDAHIGGNAKIYDNAHVSADARVYDNAQVYGHAVVCDDAEVYGNAKVYDNTWICNEAKICGNAKVYDKTTVGKWAKIYGNAEIYGRATIYGRAEIYDNAKIYDRVQVDGDAEIYGDAIVCGHAYVYDAKIYNNTKITNGDYFFEEFSCNEDVLNYNELQNIESQNDALKKIVQDFIYKVDESNKLTTQTEYDSIDEFFTTSVANDLKLDTLVICAIDTKEPLIKLQKVETDSRTEFKFTVNIINEDGDSFTFKSVIKSQEQLSQLIQKTIEALKLYPKFNRYADDLENCL